MASIDDKVVSLKFDNNQFLRGVATSMSALDKLKAALGFKGTANGLADVQKSADRFHMNGVVNAVSSAQQSFSAFGVAAGVVLGNIATQAVTTGVSLVKALTIDPAKSGLAEYETNMNSIQTILANTSAAGTNLEQVNAALDEMNHYADQTIYNFSEMARNVGTFTAAGVDLETATGSIKGIANLAALSGSNSMQASTAMYQLSQAIAAGKVTLMDWNSVVNAGMGGSVFQRALAETAVAMGKLPASALKLDGAMKNVTINGEAFRNSISAENGESWLTSEVLTSTLEQFTGDLSDAELAAQGFSAAQIDAIKKQAAMAKSAATEVKTLSGVFDTARESAGSGWAMTWRLIAGDFKEAKQLFTGISTVVNGFIGKAADQRNSLLQGWGTKGGRDDVLAALKNIYDIGSRIAYLFNGSFREFFPPMTLDQLLAISKGFKDLVANITPSNKTFDQLNNVFQGVFATLDLGRDILVGFVKMVGTIFGAIVGQGSGVLPVLSNWGLAMKDFNLAVTKAGVIPKFFENLTQTILDLGASAGDVVQGFVGLFDGINVEDMNFFSGVMERLNSRFETFGIVSNAASSGWDRMKSAVKGFVDYFQPAIDSVNEGLHGFVEAFTGAGDYNKFLDSTNTVLFGGLLILAKKFLDNGLSLDLTGGLFEAVTGAFEGLTETLAAMQAQLQAKTLMNIAIAVGVLTASVVALSLIDSAALTKALTALAVGFGQLVAAMALMLKVGGPAGIFQIQSLALAMISLAAAILVLSLALKILSTLSWDEIGRGLTALAGGIGLLMGASFILTKLSGDLLRLGIAMMPFAAAMVILAVAMKIMATLSWEDIAQGLVGLAGGLGVIVLAMAKMPPKMFVTAAALVAISAALVGIALAMKILSSISWADLGVGLVTIAGALGFIAGAMGLMPPNMMGMAAALVLVSGALIGISLALSILGAIPWENMLRGLLALAGTLLILAVGLTAMNGTLMGSAALLVAAIAISAIVPALILLGGTPIWMIVTALVALAAVFALFGVAAALLTPVVPIMLALGAAMALLGIGMAGVGFAVLAVAQAFYLFVSAAVLAADSAGKVGNAIPALFTGFAQGIIDFIVTLANGTTQIVEALVKLIMGVLDGIIQMAPKIAETVVVLIQAILTVLTQSAPDITAGALELFYAFASAFEDNIDEVADTITTMIILMIEALSRNLPRLTQAGADFIIKFLNDLADTIDRNSAAVNAAAGRVADAIINGMSSGIAGGAGKVAAAAKNAASAALDAAKNFLGIHSPSREFAKLGTYSTQGFAVGIRNGTSEAVSAAEIFGGKVMKIMEDVVHEDGSRGWTVPIPDAIVDTNPVITPVVDWSKANASGIPKQMRVNFEDGTSAMVSSDYFKVDPNFDADAFLSSFKPNMTASRAGFSHVPQPAEPKQNGINHKQIVMNQIINAPKGASVAEIYKATKNQLALAKETL